MPSYQAFNARINRLADVFPGLAEYFLSKVDRETSEGINLTDSLPVIFLVQKDEQNRAARDFSDKGYCSTKNTLYYGIKIHGLAKNAPDTLPVPEFVSLTPSFNT